MYIYYVYSSDDNDNDYDNAKKKNKKSEPLGTSPRKRHKIQWLKLNK